jgi:predicted HNH restriction endonuclease
VNPALSEKGQALLDILVAHLRKPGVHAQRPETLISYGEALELLHLPPDAPRGPTDGKTLQLNGLNDLARWVNQHPKMPRLTGVIISRSEHDDIDGTRRPKFVPSVGYFREYRRKPDDWDWWIKQVEASLAFDWSPYVRKVEVFSPAEITAAGSFAEGARVEITAQIRERSQRLRDLAREYFSRQSPDGRLHCAACDWAPPATLELSSPIVEIHHGIGIHTYPADGKALPFEEAIRHLTPLCPNCHRVLHTKRGGGSFTVEELRRGLSRRS